MEASCGKRSAREKMMQRKAASKALPQAHALPAKESAPLIDGAREVEA